MISHTTEKKIKIVLTKKMKIIQKNLIEMKMEMKIGITTIIIIIEIMKILIDTRIQEIIKIKRKKFLG